MKLWRLNKEADVEKFTGGFNDGGDVFVVYVASGNVGLE
jgi:hypothetical protein